MRWKTWLGILFAIAVFTFVFPIPTPQNRPTPAPKQPSVQNKQSASLRAQQEADNKQLLIQQDMKATEQLSRLQISRDVLTFLQRNKKQINRASSRQELQRLKKLHPEILWVQWSNGSQPITDGHLPAELHSEVKTQLAKSRLELADRDHYSSPLFRYEGESYYTVHQKDAASRQSMALLISSKIIQAVERHQLRNMRIVPYPAEGRYRIESVVPGTNVDTTVRTGEDNGKASHYAEDEIVVKFKKPLSETQLLKLRKELDLTVTKHHRSTYIFRSRKWKTLELKSYFHREWDPEFVEPHYLYLTNEWKDQENSPASQPNDTLYSEYQWNLPEISTEHGWNITKGSSDIVVAVLDTGVQANHPDLVHRMVPGVNIIDPSLAPEDDVGHGTHVAGIIAAEVNNNEGVAGLTWYTKIMPVKVLDSTGAGSTYSVAQGILWAVDHGAHIINMSLGNYAEAEFLHDALKYAHDRGVVLVAASGNDHTDLPGYPAAYPEVLAVSATDPDQTLASYSNYGDYIDVVAPGTSIPSTYPGSRYAALSGTSMAAPHVAALASLVLAVNSKLSNKEVMDLLRNTSRDLGQSGRDIEYGYGQIDVQSTLKAAEIKHKFLQFFPEQLRRRLERLRAEQ